LQREFLGTFYVGLDETEPDPWIRRGSSKTSWIVCSPTSTARQPYPSSSKADLIGYRESSEVASTRAKALTSSQHDFIFPTLGSEFPLVLLIFSPPTLPEATCVDDPVASSGIGRSEFLNDSNLNPLSGKTPLRLAHRFITSFCVA
jgi:hypothetical protein